MSEETNKTRPTEDAAKAAELSDKDLDEVAGGVAAAPSQARQGTCPKHGTAIPCIYCGGGSGSA